MAIYPNNFIRKLHSTILKPVDFSQIKVPLQMGTLKPGQGADLTTVTH